ncbi:MAG: ADP-ribosylglycohydrolase family protein [Acidobacteriota bacterium]
MRGKFEGCLLGLALGDALGAIGIGETATSIQQKYGQIKDLLGGGKLNLDPGEYTDESQMMVSVLESICTRHCFDPDNIAYRFVGWYKSRPKDISSFTSHVLKRMLEGERWQEASEGAAYDSTLEIAGSVSLVYGIPVGLYRYLNTNKLSEDSITCSRITHWDERCTHGSMIVNYAISLLVRDEPKIFDKVFEFAHDKNRELVEALVKVQELKIENLNTSDYAPTTLQAAFWILLNSQSLEGGLIRAANLGGAAPNAVAALAGAMLGAKFGRVAIPDSWLYKLIGRDRVEVLASRLYELSIL